MPQHPAVKRIGILILPAIYGSAIYQLNQFIGTLLASFLPQGSVSWLYYADRLVQFPLGVFAIAISTAALPSLSKQVAERDMTEFRETLSHSVRLTLFITIPAMAGMIVLGQPIIRVFFQRGAFGPLSTVMTERALFYYALGLWAFSVNRVLVSAFYAFQDTRTPARIATIALLANVGFSLILMGPLKHGGLALATSLASTVQFFLLILFLGRIPGVLHLKPMIESGLKSLLGSVAMGFCLYIFHAKWMVPYAGAGFWSLACRLGVIILIGVMVFFGMAVVLRCREIGSVKAICKPVLRKLGMP
jgi:putative peptidoglycan lipid II flippase